MVMLVVDVNTTFSFINNPIIGFMIDSCDSNIILNRAIISIARKYIFNCCKDPQPLSNKIWSLLCNKNCIEKKIVASQGFQ